MSTVSQTPFIILTAFHFLEDNLEAWRGYPDPKAGKDDFRDGNHNHETSARWRVYISSSFIHRETSFRRGGPPDREPDK